MKEADTSGKYDPLPVKVPVEPVKAWHDAEARTKGKGGRAWQQAAGVLREVDEPSQKRVF